MADEKKPEQEKELTHEEECTVARDVKAGKREVDMWANSGQGMIQSQGSPVFLFVTTLYCKYCGRVHLTLSPVSMPKPTGVTIPRMGVGDKIN